MDFWISLDQVSIYCQCGNFILTYGLLSSAGLLFVSRATVVAQASVVWA